MILRAFLKNHIAKFWPVALIRVSGESMLPTYRHGDVLVGWRWFRPRIGQVVTVRSDRLLVKRIVRMESSRCWVEGDNAAHSLDSRQFGWLGRDIFEVVIVFRLSSGK